MRTSSSAEVRALLARKDVLAGVLFAVAGIAGAAGAAGYGLWTADAIGAGFFPFCLGAALALLGISALVRGLRTGDAGTIERSGTVPLVLILLGTTSFALLVERAGLVPAIAALIVLSCALRLRRQPIEVLLIVAALSAFAVGLFVFAFGMPLRAFVTP